MTLAKAAKPNARDRPAAPAGHGVEARPNNSTWFHLATATRAPQLQRKCSDCEAGDREDDAKDHDEEQLASTTTQLVVQQAEAGPPDDEIDGGRNDTPVQRECSACETGESNYTQRRASSLSTIATARGAAAIRRAAATGLAGAWSPLPHFERIQSSFGHHDISNVRTNIGGAARTAGLQMGAQAFASGNRIGFRNAPDLSLAAHEAAHVVQQVSGLKLEAGIGRPGDTYERQADEVANAVAQGESAEPILDRNLAANGGTPQRPEAFNSGDSIQRREQPNGTSPSSLGNADWLTSDREGNTARWGSANLHNLMNADSSQYRQVVERRDFYRWFYEYTASRGYTTRWALAAYVVANGAYELSNMPNIEWLATSVGAVNNELQGVMREGNQVIFDNALPKLRQLIQGGPLTGQAALDWDMRVLSEEQTLIQPLYQRMSPATLQMLDNAARQSILTSVGARRLFGPNANQVVASPYNRGGTVPGFSGGPLTSVDARWRYGMQLGNTFSPNATGYTVASARPSATTDYSSGAALSLVDTRPHLHQIDAQLDYVGVPGTADAGEVRRLLGQLTVAEQRELMRNDRPGTWTGYMQPLLDLIAWDSYKTAVLGFRADLVAQMRWLEANAGDRALHWRLLNYDEVEAMIRSFSATERARLHTSAWRQVFIWICDDSTIGRAVADLGLDPSTAQAWRDEETSWW